MIGMLGVLAVAGFKLGLPMLLNLCECMKEGFPAAAWYASSQTFGEAVLVTKGATPPNWWGVPAVPYMQRMAGA